MVLLKDHCLGKSCSFGLLYVSCVNVYNLYVCFFLCWFWGWDVGFDCINSWSLPFYLFVITGVWFPISCIILAFLHVLLHSIFVSKICGSQWFFSRTGYYFSKYNFQTLEVLREFDNRGSISYTSGHFIWNLWNGPSESFINFMVWGGGRVVQWCWVNFQYRASY